MYESGTERIGDYEVLGVLGAGGMGRVYRVRNVISDRVEAIKILLPDLDGRKDLAERFLREIKLVASLNHPNIASLCTALTIDNRLIMVMEFINGTTLNDLLGNGALPVAQVLQYLDQALAALSFAHGKGIIHRDIKPANMMLTTDGVVKLMDFGIARANTEDALTQTGTTLGSLHYMSPEQITGQPVDARSDIYSLGVTLYELVSGERPFNAGSDFELMAAHVNQPPRPLREIRPRLPSGLNEIVLQAIAKNPADRFQSAHEFRSALQSINMASDQPGLARAGYSATVVEMRSGTMIPERSATTVRGSHIAREETRLVGAQTHGAPAALDVRRSPLVRHRNLLLGCGGVLALGGAIAVPVYLAHSGNQDAAPARIVAPLPAATPALASPPKKAAGVTHSAAKGLHAKQQLPAARPPAPVDKPAAIPAQTQARLDAVEVQIDGLGSRATAVNSSLNNMQRTMQRDGMALRGDMAARQASMNTNLAKARQAFAGKDVDRAERFAGLTESDVTALETFLGR